MEQRIEKIMNKIINKKILITNAGSVIGQTIIDYGQSNFLWLGGTDMDEFCYAAKVLKNKFFKVPAMTHWADYKKRLLAICRVQKIDLIIPCAIDEELLKLARDRREFEKNGTKILTSDYQSIRICNDKVKTFEFVSALGIKTPKTFLPAEAGKKIKYPVFLKKRASEGSAVTQKINSRQELDFYQSKYPDSIIQEFLKGDEFSVDMVLNNFSEVEFACCRKRVVTKAGICTKTEFADKKDLIKTAAFVAKKLKLIGGINVQFIKDYFIEINPRFPGGMGLDCRAGFNMPLVAVKTFFGLPITNKEKTLTAKKIIRIWQEVLYE